MNIKSAGSCVVIVIVFGRASTDTAVTAISSQSFLWSLKKNLKGLFQK